MVQEPFPCQQSWLQRDIALLLRTSENDRAELLRAWLQDWWSFVQAQRNVQPSSLWYRSSFPCWLSQLRRDIALLRLLGCGWRRISSVTASDCFAQYRNLFPRWHRRRERDAEAQAAGLWSKETVDMAAAQKLHLNMCFSAWLLALGLQTQLSYISLYTGVVV